MGTFKVQGQVYHLIGNLIAKDQQQTSFLQIYFVGDKNKEKKVRCGIFSTIKSEVINELQKMLHDQNKYKLDFKAAI